MLLVTPEEERRLRLAVVPVLGELDGTELNKDELEVTEDRTERGKDAEGLDDPGAELDGDPFSDVIVLGMLEIAKLD